MITTVDEWQPMMKNVFRFSLCQYWWNFHDPCGETGHVRVHYEIALYNQEY